MKVKFLTPAEIELDEIIRYYERQRLRLGVQFGSELKHTLTRIRHYPEAWSPLSPRIRRCHVNRFPYSVIYEVREDLILIVAIQHHKQEPDRWQERLT
jgi:plasmid stabilization system protein ParE